MRGDRGRSQPTMIARLTLALPLLAALALACGASPEGENDALPDEASALSVSSASRLGALHYGESAHVDYTGTPRYRAWSFTAAAGDAVEVKATSPTGDPVLWLTNASFATIEKNDDVASGDRSAAIRRTLTKAGTYWIVVSEVKRAPAGIDVSLTQTSAPPGVDAGAPDATAPGPKLDLCPNGTGSDCIRLTGTCYDAFACPVQGISRNLQAPNGGLFHLGAGGLLSPVVDEGFASSYVSGDELNQIVFREHRLLVLDGKEHGIATTLSGNDVFAQGTVTATGVSLVLRLVPHGLFGPYMNRSSCSAPETDHRGGYCSFTSAP